MFKLIYLLACTAFSASMACAAPAEKYSIIPAPEKTELKRNATRTLKLLSDKTSPALGKDAYQLTVTPVSYTPLDVYKRQVHGKRPPRPAKPPGTSVPRSP